MTVLAIEHTTIENNHVTVTAMVEDACLIFHSTYFEPEEYCPGLCQTSFNLADDEQIPTDEDGFIQYLDTLNLDWQLIPVGDY